MVTKLDNVTPHVLRHTFASVAGDLGFSELTIAGLLGHSARGVTQGYVHLDTALIVAANRVATEIARMLDGPAANRHSKKPSENRLSLPNGGRRGLERCLLPTWNQALVKRYYRVYRYFLPP